MTGGDDAVGADFAHKAVAILEDLVRASPDNLELAHDLGSAYGSRAIAVMRGQPRSGAVEEALAIYRKALEVDERLVAATQGRNATYLRGVLVERLNIALALIELQDYRGAVENARAAQPALAALAVDADNAQARLDDANLAWPLARALVAAGELDEAAAIFERSRATLEALAREGDTLKIQYLLGGAAYGLGEVHSRRASDAGSPRAARREHWRLAKDWYDKALPHFERVTASVKLDFSDQRPIDEAMRGLSRAVAEIAALEAETPIR
jgi:tetratricopeptide (TPR) repeat protein